MQYLKIENGQVSSPEAFTLFGASSKQSESKHPLVSGLFGSGGKFSLIVLLRHDIEAVVFCDRLRINFFAEPIKFKSASGEVDQKRVCVRYGGTDSSGKSRSSKEPLSATLNYGATDWPSIDLALREIVSNAIDAGFEAGLTAQQVALAVKISVVEEASVLAKPGTTQVFIPYTDDVREFHENINKWFLHFVSPELLTESVLPKNGRAMDNSERPVIYRRGVRVREIGNGIADSLFDYNLNDLALNESRTADDWKVRHEAAVALGWARRDKLSQVFLSLRKGKFWEHGFETDSLKDDYNYSIKPEEKAARQAEWKSAFEAVAGDGGCLVDSSRADMIDTVKRKGYQPLVAPSGLATAAESLGVRTEAKILTDDDLNGRSYTEATADVVDALDWCWNLVVANDMTCGKEKPKVGCFKLVTTDGSAAFGLYKNETVWVHEDYAHGNSEALRMTVVEEVAHHCSGNFDFTRGFQTWLLRIATRIATGEPNTIIVRPEPQAVAAIADAPEINLDDLVYSE